MKTFLEYIAERTEFSHSKGPGHGALMTKLTPEQHLKAADYHSSQIKMIKSGTHPNSNSKWLQDPKERDQIINDHLKRQTDHEDMAKQ